MSKIVLVCSRNKNSNQISNEKILKSLNRLVPSDFTPKKPVINEYKNIRIGIFNPTEGSYHTDNKYTYIGNLFSYNENDAEVDSDVPDGNFAFFRYNDQFLELISDAGSMYTIWYVITKDLFIASTSQRVIVFLLNSFESNDLAWPHFFCRGALGLGQSWDKRINHVRSRERIILNRNTWELINRRSDIPNQSGRQDKSEENYIEDFKNDLISVIEGIKIDWSKYRLLLSGGFDSRFLYLIFKDKDPNIRTMSWTNTQLLNDEGSDSYLAKKITDYYKTDHSIYYMENNHYSNEVILEKYLNASEGRIDHINVYMDGMKSYEIQAEKNISGLIRGTQTFGRKNKIDSSQIEILRPLAFTSPSDYPQFKNLNLLTDQLNKLWGVQKFPEELGRKSDESVFQWGERLWLDYTSHILFAALNEIKLTYIEILHPYMSSKIINSVWNLPDYLRADNKSCFRKIVESVSPPIPFAKKYATPSVDEICRDNFHEILIEELNTSYAKSLLSDGLIKFILNGISKNENFSELIDNCLNPSFIRMAFRAYIIIKMNKKLTEDAAQL